MTARSLRDFERANHLGPWQPIYLADWATHRRSVSIGERVVVGCYSVLLVLAFAASVALVFGMIGACIWILLAVGRALLGGS